MVQKTCSLLTILVKRFVIRKLRQNRILKASQPDVDFDAVDNYCLHVTTRKAMISQEDILSVLIYNFKDHFLLVFDISSIRDATENGHYPELVGELLSLELNFAFTLEHVIELIVSGERMSSVEGDKFGVVGKNKENGICSSPAIKQAYPVT